MALNFHNYVTLVDGEHLLIWSQTHVESGQTAPVVFEVFRLSTLSPLPGSVTDICRAMREKKSSLSYAHRPECELRIPTTVDGDERPVQVPELLQSLEEVLVLCHSSAVRESPTWESSNLALMVFRPKLGTYRLYPQDWFNDAGLDYGYQWVTRVARDPQTGRVIGDGIRIDAFELDSTMRKAQ